MQNLQVIIALAVHFLGHECKSSIFPEKDKERAKKGNFFTFLKRALSYTRLSQI